MAEPTDADLMRRERWWRVTAWGSGFGANGGLCATPEEAEASLTLSIENVGWSPDHVFVEELDLTEEERQEIARTNHQTEWFTGPRGGVYRLSSNGRSRIYI